MSRERLGIAIPMERKEPDEAAHGESDQLPEEAPEEVVEDDTGGEVRDQAEDSAGGADESDPGQATGNPDNAGS